VKNSYGSRLTIMWLVEKSIISGQQDEFKKICHHLHLQINPC